MAELTLTPRLKNVMMKLSPQELNLVKLLSLSIFNDLKEGKSSGQVLNNAIENITKQSGGTTPRVTRPPSGGPPSNNNNSNNNNYDEKADETRLKEILGTAAKKGAAGIKIHSFVLKRLRARHAAAAQRVAEAQVAEAVAENSPKRVAFAEKAAEVSSEEVEESERELTEDELMLQFQEIRFVELLSRIKTENVEEKLEEFRSILREIQPLLKNIKEIETKINLLEENINTTRKTTGKIPREGVGKLKALYGELNEKKVEIDKLEKYKTAQMEFLQVIRQAEEVEKNIEEIERNKVKKHAFRVKAEQIAVLVKEQHVKLLLQPQIQANLSMLMALISALVSSGALPAGVQGGVGIAYAAIVASLTIVLALYASTPDSELNVKVKPFLEMNSSEREEHVQQLEAKKQLDMIRKARNKQLKREKKQRNKTRNFIKQAASAFGRGHGRGGTRKVRN